MSFTTKTLKPTKYQPIKVQIVSRYIPVENTVGNATYILDFMRYLRQVGCEIECTVLNSSSNGNPWYIIPSSLAAVAKVSAKNNLRIGSVLLRINSLSDWLIAPLRLAYMRLPENWRNIYRSARDKQQKTHGHIVTLQGWDTLATAEEVAFASSRFVKFKPDVVVTNYAWLSNVLEVIPPNESVLGAILTHDILHKRVADFRKIGADPELSDWNWDKEAAQLRKAQVLLAIQEEEAETLKKMAPSSEVICMPMSVVCHSLDTKQVHGRCLFVGSGSSHNSYSLRWFLENVWPLVLKADPYSTLHVCGDVCKQIEESFPNVRLLGRVTNLEPEYGAAEVCLVPLLAGSGLKIKLVEAMSYSRACVSTSVGIQGLPDIVGSAVLVADTAEDFAAAIHTLLTNPQKRQCMEDQARKYVTEKLSPKAVYQPFVDRIEQHLQQVANRSTKQSLEKKLSGRKVLTSNLTPNKEKLHEI